MGHRQGSQVDKEETDHPVEAIGLKTIYNQIKYLWTRRGDKQQFYDDQIHRKCCKCIATVYNAFAFLYGKTTADLRDL